MASKALRVNRSWKKTADLVLDSPNIALKVKVYTSVRSSAQAMAQKFSAQVFKSMQGMAGVFLGDRVSELPWFYILRLSFCRRPLGHLNIFEFVFKATETMRCCSANIEIPGLLSSHALLCGPPFGIGSVSFTRERILKAMDGNIQRFSKLCSTLESHNFVM